MIPYLHLWHLNVPTFGLMLWLAAVAAALVMDRGFRRASIDADAVGMVAVAVVAGIVGAKLWHVIDTPVEFREEGWRVLWDTAGFAWYGGLIFGIAALELGDDPLEHRLADNHFPDEVHHRIDARSVHAQSVFRRGMARLAGCD